MFGKSIIVALAALTLSTAAPEGDQSPRGFPFPNDFCCALTSAVTLLHEQAAATSFCSSYLSIQPKTTTLTKTTTSLASSAQATTVTKTVTPSNTITATVITTVPSGTKATATTVPTSITVTSTRTVTAIATTTAVQTSTSTSTASITSFSTTTAVTTTTSFVTTTTTELDTNFPCFRTSNPSKRSVPTKGLRFLQGIIPKKISSACSCLSLKTSTKTLTTTTTIKKTTASPTTATQTVTAQSVVITVTSVQSTAIPATTSTSTAFVTGTATTTVTVTAASTSTIASTVTQTVTVSTTTVAITTTFSTATSTATTTATVSVGSQLTFRLATREGAAESGQELVAAAGVSSPPYNWFYWRTQHSGATTFRLDEECQLLETFAGVYAQSKPSDPNPGLVFSGSGVPVTCEIDIDTNAVDCSNPAGGDTSYLCYTTFGANTYPLWWLGEDRSPGSRCEEHNMYAAYTL